MNYFLQNKASAARKRAVAMLAMLVLVAPYFPMEAAAQTVSEEAPVEETVQTVSEDVSSEESAEDTTQTSATEEVVDTSDGQESDSEGQDQDTADQSEPSEPTEVEEQVTEPPADFVQDVVDTLVAPIVTGVPSNVTFFEKVELGVTYTYKNKDQVQVTFTQLPENPGSLSIEEVILTDEQVEALGAVSKVAYDITSDMEDGSFAYDLTLPVPAGETAAQVVYAETLTELADSATTIEEGKVDLTSEEAVIVSDLNHFTIFVVTSFEEEQTTDPEVEYNGIWFTNGAGEEVERVPTGTDGIASSVGNYHGKITQQVFTRWGGYTSAFPDGGYDTRVDVYLDMALASGSVDQRFDFSSAINTPAGSHRRDFIFSLGTNPGMDGQWLVSGSNNAPGWPGNPARSPATLTDTGWYTLEHQFRDVGGVLEVSLNIYKKGEPTPVGSWTLSDPSDVIGSTVGGNRYGWFIESDFDWLAIDQAEIEYPASAGALEVMAYECPFGTTVTRTTNGVGGTVPAGCLPRENATFGYVHGTQTDANAPYPELGAPITEAGATDGSGELSKEVPATGRYLVMETDGSSNQLPAESVLGLYCVGDADTSGTNDNQELTFVPEDGAAQCVAYSIDATGPTVPTLLSPADGTTLYTNVFTFTWEASTDELSEPVTYEFHSSLDGTESDGVLTNGLWTSGTLTSPSIDSSGAPDGTWYWQVRAQDAAGNWSDWSDIWTVTLAMMTSAIISPTESEVVDGTVNLLAYYADQNLDGNDAVQWAVRSGTCTAGTGTVFGNVDGKNTPFTWNGKDFSASIDTTTVPDGSYCLIFNPVEDSGHTNQRLTRLFTIDNPDTTPPAAPTIVFPSAEQIFTTTPILNDWTEVTDESGIGTYEIAYAYDDGHTFGGSTCPAVTTLESKTVGGCRQTTDTERNHSPSLAEQGGVTIWVRAIDGLGNVGPWSSAIHYWYDVTGVGPGTPPSPTFSSDTTVVEMADLADDFTEVAANSFSQWFFYNDEDDTIDSSLGSFVEGPETAPLGDGSAQMSVSGEQRRNLATYQFKDVKLADMATLEYSTYSQSTGNGSPSAERAAYLQFNVDFANNDTWQRRLVFLPADNGAVVNDEWQAWDAINSGDALWRYSGSLWPAGVVSNGSIPGTTARTWDAILADYPNAETRSTDSWFGFRIGEPYADGFTGNVDQFVIGIVDGINTHTETYDFEPEPVVSISSTSGGGGGGGTRNFVRDGNDGEVQGAQIGPVEGIENFITNLFGGNAAEAGATGGETGGEVAGATTTEDAPTELPQEVKLAASAAGFDVSNPWVIALILIILAGLGYWSWKSFKKA